MQRSIFLMVFWQKITGHACVFTDGRATRATAYERTQKREGKAKENYSHSNSSCLSHKPLRDQVKRDFLVKLCGKSRHIVAPALPRALKSRPEETPSARLGRQRQDRRRPERRPKTCGTQAYSA
jgi:hypothetical protein